MWALTPSPGERGCNIISGSGGAHRIQAALVRLPVERLITQPANTMRLGKVQWFYRLFLHTGEKRAMAQGDRLTPTHVAPYEVTPGGVRRAKATLCHTPPSRRSQPACR